MVNVAETNPSPIQRGMVVGSLAEKKRQVITFHADGSVSSLRSNPEKGIDIMDMGKASAMRVSDIEFNDDPEAQWWCVKFLAGPYKDTHMTWGQLFEAYPHLLEIPEYREFTVQGIAGFRTYELAVEAEIAYFNVQRLNGNMTEIDKSL